MEMALLAITLLVAGLVAGGVIVWALRRHGASAPTETHSTFVADRVRAVGKLVGLEVHAKEIATSTKGWSWMPPLFLSQAKLAMIFHFDKQYAVDLSHLRPADITELADGRYRLRLPHVQGTLRLTDVTPYDIQAGRILGFVDDIQMNAETQPRLIATAQQQAAETFEAAEAGYLAEAKQSIERHLGAFLRMLDLDVEIAWADEEPGAASERAELGGRLRLELRAVDDD